MRTLLMVLFCIVFWSIANRTELASIPQWSAGWWTLCFLIGAVAGDVSKFCVDLYDELNK